jgi:hypothetical protein
MKKIAESKTEALQAFSSWPFAILIGYLLFMILIMQGIFNGISELYFPYAYEVVVFSYTIYAALYLWSKESSVGFNQYRPVLMAAAFLMLFTPALYLLITEQLDLHTMVFGDFNAELKHMPLAWLIPYLCIVALLVPLPSSKSCKKA